MERHNIKDYNIPDESPLTPQEALVDLFNNIAINKLIEQKDEIVKLDETKGEEITISQKNTLDKSGVFLIRRRSKAGNPVDLKKYDVSKEVADAVHMYLILNDFLSKEEEQDFAITKKPTTEPAAEPAAEQKPPLLRSSQSESALLQRPNNNSSKLRSSSAPAAIGRAKVVIAITDTQLKKLKEIVGKPEKKISDVKGVFRTGAKLCGVGNVEETVQEKLSPTNNCDLYKAYEKFAKAFKEHFKNLSNKNQKLDQEINNLIKLFVKNIYTELLNIKLHGEIYYYSKTRIKHLKDKLSMLHDEIIISGGRRRKSRRKKKSKKRRKSRRKKKSKKRRKSKRKKRTRRRRR